MIKVFDNFLPERYLCEIQQMLSSNNFPWYYSPHTSDNNGNYGVVSNSNVNETPQFVHLFYYDNEQKVSSAYDTIYPSIVCLESKLSKSFNSPLRIKANMLLKSENYKRGNYHTPHIDYVDPNGDHNQYETFLFYVFDSDGDTVVFNEKVEHQFSTELTEFTRIKPKANRGILFDSNQYHASSPPISSDRRIVINYVFKK